MALATKKKSFLKRSRKNEKPKVGCGISNPTVVRHEVPPRHNQLSQHNVNKLQAAYNNGGVTQSSLRRGIGSGVFDPNQRGTGWPGMTHMHNEETRHTTMAQEQYRAREMLNTLAQEVNGLGKDKEHLK